MWEWFVLDHKRWSLQAMYRVYDWLHFDLMASILKLCLAAMKKNIYLSNLLSFLCVTPRVPSVTAAKSFKAQPNKYLAQKRQKEVLSEQTEESHCSMINHTLSISSQLRDSVTLHAGGNRSDLQNAKL